MLIETSSSTEDVKEAASSDAPENNPQYTTVYVGNLAPEVTQVDLHRHFHALGAGSIEEVRVQRDKGFGFVRYSTHAEAAMAISMGNTQSFLCGKQIKCSWGNKPTPPGTSSNPLPPPAPAALPGLSAADLLAYERQLAMSKMGGVHALMHPQGQHALKASMGMGAGASQAIYDGGFQSVAAAQQLMYYQDVVHAFSLNWSFKDRNFSSQEILKVMGISFKVSKTEATTGTSFTVAIGFVFASSKTISGYMGEASENNGIAEVSDNEVSFTLNLFPDGYSIAKPMENESGRPTSIDVPKFLHPYDRASETLFSDESTHVSGSYFENINSKEAIESGRLPVDILDDIPCKYIDGTLVCEVRDYRKCFSEGLNVASGDSSPIINRVSLRMSLENIVKDIPAISDNGWTYGDLMEVESRILKALQPQLSLDPTPQLNRLSDYPGPTKLNLALRSMRRKRLRQIPEVAVSSNNIHGKKVCLDRVPESSRLGDSGSLVHQSSYENLNTQNNVSSAMLPLRNNSFGADASLLSSPLVPQQSKYQIGVGSPRMIKDQRSGALLNASVASPGGQDMMIPFTDNGAASIHGKSRDNQDGQLSPLTHKKPRLSHTGADGNLQHLGPQMDNLHGSELHWKNTLLQPQSIGRGIQYANSGVQKFSPQMYEGGLNQEGGPIPFTIGQQGIRYNLKEEPVETERLDKPELSRMSMGEAELSNIDPQQSRLQQRMPHQFMRSSFPQTPWNNLGQPLDNNPRKEDSFQKRKLVQSPRVSAGGLPQSPLSSKSGEFSSGSIGPQFGAVVTSGLVSSQKEKSAVTSVPSVGVGGNPSFTSSANDSMQRQNPAQAAAKRRSNSLPKTPAISGVGSPASVSNMSVPITASSPPVGTQTLGDQTMLERFSKIEVVAMRCQLNCKKNKVDEYPMRKPNAYSAQQLVSHLSSDSNNENLKDETCKMPLSKSLIGGNMNVCKTRILNFIQTERIIQGNGFQYVPKARTRMIMSEKPNDGAVQFILEK
ncbi:UNVERIFIED_CONTAM: protein PHYTOCHROME-DEPENDENT LATE-FLOWERING [Sesamum angustifolium]|uniref:Protein PHYTOCHROME-DEPENDENT LATE-FLOWERING n=1 Tax=Sesamum angustifolium TaxID=2727405 RepID=A0AAW2LLX7_9LAMI